MNIEIPDEILKLSLSKLAADALYDILRDDDNVRAAINSTVKKNLLYMLEGFDFDSFIKNKVDTILDETAESFLRRKGKEVIKNAWEKFCSEQQTKLPISEA